MTSPSITRLPPHGKRMKYGQLDSLRQCIAMQRAMHKLALDDHSNPSDRTKAALAWTQLEERKRIIRGRPLPGVLTPTTSKANKWQAPSIQAA